MTGYLTGRPAGEEAGPDHRRLFDHVVEQLAGQLPAGPAVPVLIPTVGFGGQSGAVLDDTIAELARQRCSVPISVVFLVNRPASRPADDTMMRARAAISRAGSAAVRFGIAEVVMPSRMGVGELRQLMLDAVIRVQRLDPASTGFVVADDDLVAIPAGVLEELRQAVTGPVRADLAAGPVLFDSRWAPAPMLPVFFAADALRALLAARFIRRQRATAADPEHTEQFARYAESIALSGNLMVRVSALAEAGGFVPYNEITGVLRGVHALGSARLVGIWDFRPDDDNVLMDLYRRAIRISARRALAAYLSAGVPSVAQWRVCRFRSSRVDPVRLAEPTVSGVAQPISRMRTHQIKALSEELTGVLSATLRYFPPDAEVITDCLEALGLSAGSTLISLGGHATDTTVRVKCVSGLLDRIREVQEISTPGCRARSS
ncbi:hypothetical protein [Mycobacterium gastri]|uniref:Uncharacterized protein n=1 Tax=Mycobacterium gastri TaxID=1777 RepID=A0A1X1UU55_MYCGS|nr:hypothetical protein [Mycobacterium gastri]ETW23539.1 hypothetical protein MGAST_13645 [Mycobacterium gastri 'Wayne']ORV60346.1 hypothetical protein AWC07_18200 [Mycobacterium gastri]